MIHRALSSFLLGLLLFFVGTSLYLFESDTTQRTVSIYGLLSTQNQHDIQNIEADLKTRFAHADIAVLPNSSSPTIALRVPVSERISRVKAYLSTVDHVDEWVSDADLKSSLQNDEIKIRLLLWLCVATLVFLSVTSVLSGFRRIRFEKSNEIELWRALGATRPQIFRHFFFPVSGLWILAFVTGGTLSAFYITNHPKACAFGLSRIDTDGLMRSLSRSPAPVIETEALPTPEKAPSIPRKRESFAPPLQAFLTRQKRSAIPLEKQGILLDVASSEPVMSVLSGTVVYDGAMKGLGRMIIVDHGHGLHSVYAHLGALKTRIDDRLQKGQIIGYTGADEFYFELRQNGKPKPIDGIFK